MTLQPLALRDSTGLRRAWLVVLLFLVVQTALLPTVTASPTPPSAAVVAPLPASVCAQGTGLGRFLSFMEAKLSDRRRMVQLAALGMCIGLYILMRK